jgi:hypothetical protein
MVDLTLDVATDSVAQTDTVDLETVVGTAAEMVAAVSVVATSTARLAATWNLLAVAVGGMAVATGTVVIVIAVTVTAITATEVTTTALARTTIASVVTRAVATKIPASCDVTEVEQLGSLLKVFASTDTHPFPSSPDSPRPWRPSKSYHS